MNHISYFKLQAKNLLRDYKTQKLHKDQDGRTHYTYSPKFFDIDGLFLDYDWNEEKFSLMKAQHFIALMLGFSNWGDLLKASDCQLELTRLLFDNQDKLSLDEWEMYIDSAESENGIEFDDESRLEIFKNVFLNVDGHSTPFLSYRLSSR